MPSPERASEGQWSFKKVDEVMYVKVNDSRARSKIGHIMEDVEQIKPGRSNDSILVGFYKLFPLGRSNIAVFQL